MTSDIHQLLDTVEQALRAALTAPPAYADGQRLWRRLDALAALAEEVVCAAPDYPDDEDDEWDEEHQP